MNRTAAYLILALCLPCMVFAAKPRRVVCLAPSITENLFLLGEQESIVGVTLFCTEDVSGKELIGTLEEPNIEKIYTLSPDLVIATKAGNRKQTVEQLRSLGINVLVLEPENDFEGICANFAILGKLTEKEDKAREILSSARDTVNGIRGRAQGREPVKIFWEIGVNPLFTIGKNNFVNEYNHYTGAVNIFDDITGIQYPQVNREEVIKRDPDVIFLVTMAGVSPQEQKNWEKYGTLKAVKSKKVYMLDGAGILQPTPSGFVRGVETIFGLLYPELQNEK